MQTKPSGLHPALGAAVGVAVFGICCTCHAAQKTELQAAQQAQRTNISVTVTRLLVPVVEARVEHAPGERWSLAGIVAYGGDLETSTFAEISVFGLGARGNWLLLGDRRSGLGVAAELRWERHIGISPQLGNDANFDSALGNLSESSVITRLAAERTILAGGAIVFARASRRALFVELNIGAGWQKAWTQFVQNEQTAEKRSSQEWLPWSIAIGVWL